MACTASVIILSLFIAQAAANTNIFIEAAYCERVISEYTSVEYSREEIADNTEKLKKDLEKMPGVRAEISGGKLSIYLDGVIGPASALGIEDNSLHIEKELELKIKEKEDEQSYYNDGDHHDTDAANEGADGNESYDDPGDVS